MKTTFSAEGDIRSTDILAALVGLWREGASGALHFSRSGATAGFHLSAGELTAVTSSDSRFETASILLRAGKLDTATLERLTTPEGGDRALSALRAGILTKREWRWGEKIRAVEVLSDLLSWIEGDYVFDRGAHADAGEFRLTVPRLILELFLRSRDRGLVLHYLGGADVPLARAPHFDSEFAAFGLTADAEAVVRLIDGRATAAQIASDGPAEPFAVEKLLAALVTLGLVHPEYVAADAAPAATAGRMEPEEPEEGESRQDGAPSEEEAPGAPAAYTELDVGEAAGSAEPELDRELGEPEHAEPEADELEVGESEIGESEIGAGYGIADEPSIAAERLRPGVGEPERTVEYERLGEPAHREDAGTRAREVDLPGPSSLEPDERPRLALDFATGVGSPERPKPRSPGPLLWLLAALAAGVAAVILFRSHGSPARIAASAETQTPVAVPTGELAVLSELTTPAPTEPPPVHPTAAAAAARTQPTMPQPTKPLPTRPQPTKAAAALRPSPRPAATAAPPRATPAAEPPGSTRQAWLDRAARDRQRATADRKAHFTIQLELACETSTLVDAWKYDRPAGTLWVLATPFDGKTCFRVLWGRYPTKEAARRALAGVPPFFSAARNRPVVTAIR